MATPKNLRATKAPRLMDPLLNFKFRILWDDGKTPVAGVSKIGALSRTTEATEWREGAAPQVARKIPGQTSYGDITLERGLIIDVAFEQWANKVWFYERSGTPMDTTVTKDNGVVSLKDFRKDITIQLCNQAGQIMKSYLVFNCWPTEYQALPDLDASSNDVALETMTLANEGWQRDDDLKDSPTPLTDYPSIEHPEAPGSS